MAVNCYFCEKVLQGFRAGDEEPVVCGECGTDSENYRAARRVWDARIELNDAIKALFKVKHKGEPIRISEVFVFQNGNVAVFDQFQDQMPDFQGVREEVREKIIEQINKQIPEYPVKINGAL